MSKKVGTPVWVDYGSNNFQACTDFYQQLFGWRFEDLGAEFNSYNLVRCGDALVGGLMDVSGMECPTGGPVPSEWGVFLHVEDLAARTAKAKAAGGEVAMEDMTVGDSGTWSLVVDPTGAPISLWQPKELESYDFVGAPGTPVWFELMTKDFDAAVAFYREVFDFDIHMMSDTDEFRYASNGDMENATAGICYAPWLGENDNSYWRVYFGVDGADSAAEKVASLGGKVTDGPEDSPFGRIVTVLDREGATFQLCSMSEATGE